ncbi:putative Dihydroxy acid dehydratase [Taphrina deformans PYCC 5710]|uniref:Dihydroxy acid dehydratase n=1 Tax=Taphrina deformans (strain PYCC 5710 / ATCC 11124 / CBS 356.35 / IMI 108563 / JCM 9778 / NBRC 8474) TaxID=1097556 RepID=R4X9X4_TAPDE|nr:putative Dihydroxy acid dehydratase [Taphrina deformans PYCC 5710]|eukprot:CCG82307.1 putative Dihydroxy acid dehydratase [Taphrina deformans PYCC 5710]
MTVNGSTIGANTTKKSRDRNIIYPYEKPLMADAGFLNLGGTLFDSAIMKTCVISQEFKDRYLSNPTSPNVFEGTCVVFDGPEDYHKSIDTLPEIDEYTILIMRGAGPLGYPGAAEVVNMQPPGRLLKQGITTMPCIGDGRQSGTSGTPSILNASPESAVAGSGLSIVKTGDRIKIDLNTCRVDLLLDQESMARRHEELERAAKPRYPESQTPWQEMFRDGVDQLAQGMVMKRATKYQRIVQKFGTPRDNH